METSKSDINVTDLSGNFVHSKSTDLIKPQGSVDNLEAQNGKAATHVILKPHNYNHNFTNIYIFFLYEKYLICDFYVAFVCFVSIKKKNKIKLQVVLNNTKDDGLYWLCLHCIQHQMQFNGFNTVL